MPRHLLIRLEAPLIAFGGETIDNFGVIRDFPALSMVTGLLANALGWRREEDERHNRLQQRIVMGARIERMGERFTDFQTAQLGAKDAGWTTMGIPESRQGGATSYDSPHLRYRDYHADPAVLVALRLEPVDESPALDELAEALNHPARPLFIGRKPCLPMSLLFAGWADSKNLLHALRTAPAITAPRDKSWVLQWPDGEGEFEGDRLLDLCDERNWTSGVHGGWRPVRQVAIRPEGV
ncbi:MAG: type I-E CRISPR-associated protein Cas5/CasD [Gammaproteobacteria bacterium]|nr:type I-E CRISPR-associated protein Cas5/CasD [Gammaproteobacteria bacterium]